jgi:mono/diheme cytochrome c family protein
MIPIVVGELSGGEIVRRSRIALIVVSLVAALSLITACGDSSDEDAQTPEGATTVANSALQTDSNGETVTAPPTSVPAETEGETETEAASGGDPADGQEIFAASCTGCHLNGGNDAGGVGPQLAGMGLAEDTVKSVVENGQGAMPGGLVSGEDLDDVAAYVVSLQ